MKNLLFGLIAIVLFAFNGNAQKITQESVRLQLAQGMSDLTSTLKPAFDKTSNAEDFKKVIKNWNSHDEIKNYMTKILKKEILPLFLEKILLMNS